MTKQITQDEWDSMREGDWSNNASPSWLDWLPPWALAVISLAAVVVLGALAWWAFTEFVNFARAVLL